MAYIAPIAAVVAAAQKKKQEEEEEALMANFMNEDKSGNWEYKIIRGIVGAFRSETRMRRALENESQAGWELAMKLDDERMILRRPRSASRHDGTLASGASPYRTDYGGNSFKLVVAFLVLLLGAAVFIFLAFAGREGVNGDSVSLW
ncbi:MAG: hypothetical protein P1S60_02325 [Anaerolineae bacterium]|nr:hypothetical protein [Anaerolineae bacterium]